MRLPNAFLLAFFPLVNAAGADHFTPTDRVSGIGISRDDVSDELLNVRMERMIESQTFSIMRDPQALPVGQRAGVGHVDTPVRGLPSTRGEPP